MKKVKIFEYLAIFSMALLIGTLAYGYVLGYAQPVVPTTIVPRCNPIQVLTPTGDNLSGIITITACTPYGAAYGEYRLVNLYNTTIPIKSMISTTIDASGKITFPALDTKTTPDGAYQLNIMTYTTAGPLGPLPPRNIWIRNYPTIVTPPPTNVTQTTGTTTNTTTTTPTTTVTQDIANTKTTIGTQSTATVDQYVAARILEEEMKKLPPELKAAPLSIVLSTEKAAVLMLDDTKGKVTLSGRAEPNTTIWLYIFSDPIVVSVNTDSNGNWNYSLDKELATGKHDVYVAVKNADGTLQAKSAPYSFFVGTATAAASGEAIAPVTEKPNYTLYYIVFAVAAVSLIISVIFYLVAKSHVRKHEKLA